MEKKKRRHLLSNPNTLKWRKKNLLRDRRKVTVLSILMLDFGSQLVGGMHGKVAVNTLLSISENHFAYLQMELYMKNISFLGRWEESYRNEQLLSLVKKGAFPSVMVARSKTVRADPW